MNTFFLGVPKKAKMVDFGTFLDLTQLLGRVKGSNLVQIARNTSADVVEQLTLPVGSYITLISLLGCPENQDFDPKNTILGFLRPLEASRGNIM